MFNREATPKTDKIMKSIKTLLPALGLVLGATLAMAMNVPTIVAEKTATKVWTPDPDPEYEETNFYREITGELQGTDYLCNGASQECRVEFDNDNPMTGQKSILSPGVYVEQ